MFIAELDHPHFDEFDLTSLRTGIMAGAPCPVEVMKQVQSGMHMPEITIGYGMTETSPVSTQTAGTTRWIAACRRSAGSTRTWRSRSSTPSPALSSRAAARRTLHARLQRDDRLLGNDEATRAAIDAAGWMHTGDLATLDEEGYVNIVGRIKDMIIRGGENVYPREVEEFLYTHTSVWTRRSLAACESTAKKSWPG